MSVNKINREYQRLYRELIVSNLINFYNDTSKVSFFALLLLSQPQLEAQVAVAHSK